MATEAMVIILSRLVFGAIATFLAIVLWSRTRDVAWMLIVIGTIISYGEVLFTTLESFGMVEVAAVTVYGVSAFRVVFANLPTIFFILAFSVMIARK
jgi:methylmalonyl-CoA mutase cobalamin-binding subunit